MPTISDQNNQTQVESINLGMTQQQVIELVGDPIHRSTTSDGITSFRYTSDTPTYTNYLYFQNDTLELISLSQEKATVNLVQFLNQHGNPTATFVVHTEVQDSTLSSGHVWPQAGLTVFSQGNQPQSKVTRIHKYQPTNLTNYFQTWGKKYSDKPTTEVRPDPTPIVSQTSNQPIEKTSTYQLPVTILIIVVFAVAAITLYFYRKRRHGVSKLQRTQTGPIGKQASTPTVSDSTNDPTGI